MNRRAEDELVRQRRQVRRDALLMMLGLLIFWTALVWTFWPKHTQRAPRAVHQVATRDYTAPSRAHARCRS